MEKNMLWAARIVWPLTALVLSALAVVGAVALAGRVLPSGSSWILVVGTISWTGGSAAFVYASYLSWRWR